MSATQSPPAPPPPQWRRASWREAPERQRTNIATLLNSPMWRRRGVQVALTDGYRVDPEDVPQPMTNALAAVEGVTPRMFFKGEHGEEIRDEAAALELIANYQRAGMYDRTKTEDRAPLIAAANEKKRRAAVDARLAELRAAEAAKADAKLRQRAERDVDGNGGTAA